MMPCAYCPTEQHYQPGESQCINCLAWWFSWQKDGVRRCARVYDRERTTDQLTAYEQTVIMDAIRFLEDCGQCWLVDFGFENAVRLATACGFVPTPTTPSRR
jgi:hypothetical protein